MDSPLWRQAVGLIESQARSQGIGISLVLADRPLMVEVDAIQIEQVLLNLVANVIEAMKGCSKKRRRLTIRTDESKGDQVTVEVSDTGVGLPSDPVSRVFEPFYTTRPRGMGVGLSISRTIVEAHEGKIAAHRNPNGGAVVVFSLSACAPTGG